MNRIGKRLPLCLAACLIAAAGLLSAPGCAGKELVSASTDVATLQHRLDDATATAAAAADKARVASAQLDNFPADSQPAELVKARDDAQAAATAAAAQAIQYQAALPAAQQRLNDATQADPLTAIEAGVHTASDLIPGYGSLLAAAAGLVFGLIRAGRNRQIAREIAKSWDAVIAQGHVDMAKAGPLLDSIQSPAVKYVVNEAQNKAKAAIA